MEPEHVCERMYTLLWDLESATLFSVPNTIPDWRPLLSISNQLQLSWIEANDCGYTNYFHQ